MKTDEELNALWHFINNLYHFIPHKLFSLHSPIYSLTSFLSVVDIVPGSE